MDLDYRTIFFQEMCMEINDDQSQILGTGWAPEK